MGELDCVALPVATLAAASPNAITFSATMRFASRAAAGPPKVNFIKRKPMTC
jgi:hypothetical protein